MIDPYAAVWVSHSSLEDYLKCPRAYYLKHVYRTKNKRKILLVQPPLSLGHAVHTVLEELAQRPVAERDLTGLLTTYETIWQGVAGKQGGFATPAEERTYYERGQAMLQRVQRAPGLLLEPAIRLKEELPHYCLSEEGDGIMLCGKIDWLQYIPEDNSVHIIDFKTGLREEREGSFQLPIYALLVSHGQKRKVTGVSYWYLESSDTPTATSLPDLQEAEHRVLDVATDLYHLRKSGQFRCPHGGCFACEGYEAIINGQAEYLGVTPSQREDMYFLAKG